MTFIYSNDIIGENFEKKMNKITSLSPSSTAPHTRERPSKKKTWKHCEGFEEPF